MPVGWPNATTLKSAKRTRAQALGLALVIVAGWADALHFMTRQEISLTTPWQPALPLTELPQGQMKACNVGGRDILICHTRDGLFALDNTCTHASARMSEGRLRGYRLICPLHGASFDARTGHTTARVPPAAGARRNGGSPVGRFRGGDLNGRAGSLRAGLENSPLFESRSAFEKPHFHAGKLNHVVVVQSPRLRADGHA